MILILDGKKAMVVKDKLRNFILKHFTGVFIPMFKQCTFCRTIGLECKHIKNHNMCCDCLERKDLWEGITKENNLTICKKCLRNDNNESCSSNTLS
jgi:hypothetical protein